ncbi:MAG: hypothetical protein A4E29_00598 [Methanomassiliicoccales archaeon PtaB.Bin134]|nr:MAG: hypothetical protein A4E29_00598 [Methanomassiliicoccales archaeon PtaB.Bin134]
MPLLQFDAPSGAPGLVDGGLGVFQVPDGLHRAGPHAAHASHALLLFHWTVRRDLCGGENGDEALARAVFRGQQHVVDAEGPQPGQVGRVAMGEEGVGVVDEKSHLTVAVPGNIGRRMSHAVEHLGELVGPLVKLGVEVLVQLLVPYGGRGLQYRQGDRQPQHDHRTAAREYGLGTELPGWPW